jgi:predicted dehydrogenase
MATLSQDVEVEDSVSVSYRYQNGALGVLEATTAQVGPPTYEQVIRGREGQLVVAPVLRFWSQRTVMGYDAGRWHKVRTLAAPAERRDYFAAFAQNVLGGGAMPVTPEDARAVQATIEAAYSSVAQQRTVLVPHPAKAAPPRDGDGH